MNAIIATALTKRYSVRGRGWAAKGAGFIGGVADVSFQVERSGAVAIIGRNGAGKSTLLRMLAGLARPSSGDLQVVGRRGCLLELGAGFVEEWSGNENARTTLTLLGMSPSEAASAMAFAEDFSELGHFLEKPVRIYSAGMRLRLAYSLVIAARPEVIIADEVLGVGDEAFQRKCSHHVLQFLRDGGTMVLATHNLYLAERLCQTAIWLDAGRARAQGSCHEVTKAYLAHLEASDGCDTGSTARRRTDAGPSIWIDGQPREGANVPFAMPLRIVVGADEGGRIEVRRPNGTLVLSLDSPGVGTSEITHPSLLPGRYFVRLVDKEARVLDEISISCVGERRELGTVYLEHQWT